jgi:hypothetical protein
MRDRHLKGTGKTKSHFMYKPPTLVRASKRTANTAWVSPRALWVGTGASIYAARSPSL